uniref:Amidohydrolase-related domain-containing protein n=1 Tax=Fusarium oxysporum (strain Fo5176) TaxID=660025 RepID=A0A0D2XYN4_FUSOF
MSQSLLSQLWKQIQPSRHNKRQSTQTAKSTTILLQNGLVIEHGEQDSVQVVDNTDILIVDGIIKEIGKSIKPPPHAEVVDCSNKIISPPGFINTHHHLWQTQLKGYGTDHCWLEYFSDAAISALEKYSLFPAPEDDYTIVISHGNYMDDGDFSILKKHRVPLACTPATEAQGSMGWHLLFEPGLITALGADCHCLTSSSLMQAARTALLFSRLQKTLELKEKGQKVDMFDHTSHGVFNKATIEAARAVGLESEIGSIAVGKRADILVFSRDQSLAFGASAREEPVAAIVTYSEARDIEAVLVNGCFRKRDGKMVPVMTDRKDIGLDQVLKELDQSQKNIRQKRESCSTRISKGLVCSIAQPGQA